jgi:selenocysteine lyase/cysteine desulfurase
VALNAGANNAMPRTVAETWQHCTAFTNLGPLVNRRILSSQRDSVRARIAGLIKRPPTEVALTRNTTEGLNIVIGGYRLGRGDEIVATDHEYPNTMNALKQRAARDGVTLTLAAIPIAPTSSAAVVEAIQSVLLARTKLLVTPHIADPTGQLLPVSALARLARARGVAYLVDGALGFGTVDVDLLDIGCDFYATSLQGTSAQDSCT